MKNIVAFALFVLSQNLLYQEIKTIALPEIINSSSEAVLSVFTDSVYYIKLETNPDCLIGNIGAIKKHGDKIIIYDRSSNRLLVFNQNGKFLNQIGKVGRGPGEYSKLRTGFVIDSNRNSIYIINGDRRVLIEYGINGRFVREIPTDFYVTNLEIDGDNLLCYTSSAYAYLFDSHLIHVINGKGEILRKVHKVDIGPNSADHMARISMVSGKMLYWERPWEEVYSYEESRIKKVFSIDYGRLRMPTKLYYDYERFPDETQNYLIIHDLMFFNDFIYMQVMLRNKKTYYYFFPKNREGYKTEYSKDLKGYGIENDLDYGPRFTFDFKIADKESCHICEPFDLKSLISETRNDTKFKGNGSLLDLINILEITDNPVLQIIKLK